MATQQGSFTGAIDACDDLVAFLQSSGWTLNKTETYSGTYDTGKAYCLESPQGLHFILRSVDAGRTGYAFEGGGGTNSNFDFTGIGAFGARGFNAADSWHGQVGLSKSWDASNIANTAPWGVSAFVDQAGTYDFFVYNEACYAFFKFSDDYSTYLIFGGADPIGTGSADPVQFLSGTHGTYQPSSGKFDYEAHYGPFTITSGAEREGSALVYQPVAGAWCSNTKDSNEKHEAYMGGYTCASMNFGKFNFGSGSVMPFQDYSGKPSLAPIYILASKDPVNLGSMTWSMVGVLPHAFSVGMMELTDGGEYDYPTTGGTTYRVRRVGSIVTPEDTFDLDLGWWMGMAMEV